MVAIDPVCNMTVDPARAAGSSEYRGETFYFCSLGCKAKFEAEPEKYLRQAPHPALRATLSPHAGRGETEPGEWTCPMHPEVVSDHPGACPICGMALEPRTISLEERPNEELIDMRRRFVVSAILSAPI